MSKKLADLIKEIRNCKTIAEEKAIINKEKAGIRQSFSGNQHEYRPRNIAKLLFINLLGYETDFGQMECLNLISRPSFMEKKIGYLGITQLFSEKSEILMMATHRLLTDLQAENNHYVQATALQTISQIADRDMSQVLGEAVAKLIKKGYSYIAKKACLCGYRILYKFPEHSEIYHQAVIKILSEKNHGLIISSIPLAIKIMEIDPTKIDEYEKQIPHLVSRFRTLLVNYSDEFLVNEVTDPFLQISLLQFFKVVYKGKSKVDENLQQLLQDIPNETKIKKNTGNAVLYECAMTILSLEVGAQVKSAGMDIITKMLTYQDINSVYVSLSLFSYLNAEMKNGGFSHLPKIFDCLRENDQSIQRMSLKVLEDLSCESNVKEISGELQRYLVDFGPEDELVGEVTEKLCSVIENYSPTRKWQVDKIIKSLALAGRFVTDDSISTFLQLIAATPELQPYALSQMFDALNENLYQDALARVAFWSIGEFADLIHQGKTSINTVTIFEVIDKLLELDCSSSIKCYMINCIAKLSIKLPGIKQDIERILKTLITDQDEEIQQRAFEYLNILQLDSITNEQRKMIFDAMPVAQKAEKIFARKPVQEGDPIPEFKTTNQTESLLGEELEIIGGQDIIDAPEEKKVPHDGELFDLFGGDVNPAPAISPVVQQINQAHDLMGGLMDLDFGGASNTQPSTQVNQSQGFDMLTLTPTPQINTGTEDLMDLAFGGLNQAPSLSNTQSMGGLEDLMGFGDSSTPQIQKAESTPGHHDDFEFGDDDFDFEEPKKDTKTFRAYEDSNLNIDFECIVSGNKHEITAKFNNKGMSEITQLATRFGSPGYLSLEYTEPTSQVLPGGSNGLVSQNLMIFNNSTDGKGLALKLRITYTLGGVPISQDSTIRNFPN